MAMNGECKSRFAICVAFLFLAGPSMQFSMYDAVVGTAKEILGIDDIEEAPYNLISSNDEYEEREYISKKWVCAPSKTINDPADEVMDRNTFWKLFGYINSGNEAGTEIAMTAPVSMEYTKSSGTEKVTSCFFIGEEHQANVPAPNDTSLAIVQRGNFVIFTRKFGGYAFNMERWSEEASALKALLKAKGEPIVEDKMYLNGFNSPMKFWNRRNEVWILKNNAV